MSTTMDHSCISRLQDELMHLMGHHPPGITAFPVSDENLRLWTATIEGPPDSAFHGLHFKLQIQFPQEYPFRPPTINFTDRVWHPNIGIRGEVCLDILQDKWSAVLNIEKILISLQSLLSDPNPRSPLNSVAAKQWIQSKGVYNERVRSWYLGNN